MKNINNIEDLLAVVLGIHGHEFVLKKADTTILNSFYRQINKGIAFTDRQYSLLKLKLEIYSSQFKKHNIENWQAALDNTQGPLREIDRSKYVSLVNYEEFSSTVPGMKKLKKGTWIKIRFPFNKKHICKIENCAKNVKSTHYFHPKNSHEHYFYQTPYICYKIVSEFKQWNIDEQIIDIAQKVKQVIDTKSNFIPMVVDDKLINVTDKVMKFVGDESITDNKLLADRSIRYGYVIHTNECGDTLADKICYRTNPKFLADPKKFSMEEISKALESLKRYPLLVCVDSDDCYEQVKDVYQAFSHIVPAEYQSVLFRAEKKDKQNFIINEFIQQNNLNNWVDNTTKIVYIKKDKLPKVLLKSDFKPTTALFKTSIRSNSSVANYLNFNCDLILFHEEHLSVFNIAQSNSRGYNTWPVVN